MDPLVALLAALGGLVAGAGLGVVFARRSASEPIVVPDERLHQAVTKLREKVTPVMERRAEALGISVPARARLRAVDDKGAIELSGDEVDRLVAIATLISQKEDAEQVGLSDTVQLSKEQLAPVRKEAKSDAE